METKITISLGLSWWQSIKYKYSKKFRDKINKEFEPLK